MGKYNSIQEVFDILHAQKVDYAVLRNYSNLLEDDIYMDGHGDIDIICADSLAIVNALNAYSNDTNKRDGIGNGTHYYIYLKDKKVSLDLRHIGDDYYCEKWQREMLATKVWKPGFYILNKEQHFYTLIYHAIIQKRTFSLEYEHRLKRMGERLEIPILSTSSSFYIQILERYMKQHNYTYNYPSDKYVPLLEKHIQDRSLLVMNYKKYLQHKMFEAKIKCIELMVFIYHKTFKRL